MSGLNFVTRLGSRALLSSTTSARHGSQRQQAPSYCEANHIMDTDNCSKKIRLSIELSHEGCSTGTGSSENRVLVGELDAKCPHPITSEELREWTSLDRLKKDFHRFSTQIEQADGKMFSREVREIFEIPTDFEGTEANIIDLRLCAHIKMSELISSSSLNTWSFRDELELTELHKSPNIIETFVLAKEAPDVRWFYLHRVMRLIMCLRGMRVPRDSKLRESIDSLSIDNIKFNDHESLAIIRDLVCRCLKIETVGRFEDSHNLCYIPSIESLCKQHESLLERSIKSTMEQLAIETQGGKTMSLLHILLKIAYDQNKWHLLDESLIHLLAHSNYKLRKHSITVFLWMVSFDQGYLHIEEIKKHANALLEIFSDPLFEVRQSSKLAWATSITNCACYIPKGRPALRAVVDSWIDKYYKMTENKTSDFANISNGLIFALRSYAWLIVPRYEKHDSLSDIHSKQDQLLEDFGAIASRKIFFKPFCRQFNSVNQKLFQCCERCADPPDDIVMIRKCILHQASWLLAERFGETELDYISAIRLLVISSDASLIPTDYYGLEYSAHCELLAAIFNQLNCAAQSAFQGRFRTLFGLTKYLCCRKHDMEALCMYEASLVLAFEKKIKLSTTIGFKDRFIYNPACDRIVIPPRFAYFEHSPEKLSELCMQFPSIWSHKVGRLDIYSRRISLLTMCKLSMSRPELIFEMYAPTIVNLLDELQTAYKLRATQGVPRNQRDKFLVPSCADLAFSTAFDDSRSSIYMCEFRYFRDTMEYLRRNELQLFENTLSKMERDKRQRLNYYRGSYDNFDMCCATPGIDRQQMKFRCISHPIEMPVSYYGHKAVRLRPGQVCPLLGRQPYLDYL